MHLLLLRFSFLFVFLIAVASLYMAILAEYILGYGAISVFDENILIFILVAGFFSALIISEFCDRRAYEKSIITSVKILQERYKQAVRETADEVFLFLSDRVSLSGAKEKNEIILKLGLFKGLFLERLGDGFSSSDLKKIFFTTVNRIPFHIRDGYSGRVAESFTELLLVCDYPFKIVKFPCLKISGFNDAFNKKYYILPIDLTSFQNSLKGTSVAIESSRENVLKKIEEYREKINSDKEEAELDNKLRTIVEIEKSFDSIPSFERARDSDE